MIVFWLKTTVEERFKVKSQLGLRLKEATVNGWGTLLR